NLGSGFTGSGGCHGGFTGMGFTNIGGGFNIGFLPRISPGTPTINLVPPPIFGPALRPWPGRKPALVPQVGLTPPFPHDAMGSAGALQLFAGATHLEGKERDGFVNALLENRPDLAGLPFLRGGACRPSPSAMRYFAMMRKEVLAVPRVPRSLKTSFAFGDADVFWDRLENRWSKLRAAMDRGMLDKPDPARGEVVTEEGLYAAKV